MTTIRTEDIGLILAQGEPVAGVARAVTGNQSGQRWRGETQVAGAFKQHSNTTQTHLAQILLRAGENIVSIEERLSWTSSETRPSWPGTGTV